MLRGRHRSAPVTPGADHVASLVRARGPLTPVPFLLATGTWRRVCSLKRDAFFAPGFLLGKAMAADTVERTCANDPRAMQRSPDIGYGSQVPQDLKASV